MKPKPKFTVTLPPLRRVSFDDQVYAYAKRLADGFEEAIKPEGADNVNFKALLSIFKKGPKRAISFKLKSYWLSGRVTSDVPSDFVIDNAWTGPRYTAFAFGDGVYIELDKPVSVSDYPFEVGDDYSIKPFYSFAYSFDYYNLIDWVQASVERGFSTIKQARRDDKFPIAIKSLEKFDKRLYDQLGQVFGCFKVIEEERSIDVLIEKFDWDKGARYYFHGSSCWWGGYRYGAQMFGKSPHSYAVLVYEAGEIVGRCWLYGNLIGGTFFNFYGKLNPQFLAEIFAAEWGIKIRVNKPNPAAIKRAVGLNDSRLYVNHTQYCAYGHNNKVTGVTEHLASEKGN